MPLKHNNSNEKYNQEDWNIFSYYLHYLESTYTHVHTWVHVNVLLCTIVKYEAQVYRTLYFKSLNEVCQDLRRN